LAFHRSAKLALLPKAAIADLLLIALSINKSSSEGPHHFGHGTFVHSCAGACADSGKKYKTMAH
jgi:hypothetical protein